MHPVAEALKSWRQQSADTASLSPNGTPLIVRLDVDPDAGQAAALKSVLSVRISTSERRAVVPFTCTEVVTVGSGSLPVLTSTVDAIEQASGQCFQYATARLHRITRVSTTWDDEAGLVRAARIEWEGTASWL